MFRFYTPWKCQKVFRFLMFLGGIEMKYWLKWVNDQKIIAKVKRQRNLIPIQL